MGCNHSRAWTGIRFTAGPLGSGEGGQSDQRVGHPCYFTRENRISTTCTGVDTHSRAYEFVYSLLLLNKTVEYAFASVRKMKGSSGKYDKGCSKNPAIGERWNDRKS